LTDGNLLIGLSLDEINKHEASQFQNKQLFIDINQHRVESNRYDTLSLAQSNVNIEKSYEIFTKQFDIKSFLKKDNYIVSITELVAFFFVQITFDLRNFVLFYFIY
jgi:hypothetical protein